MAEKFTGDTPAPFKKLIRGAGLIDERYEHRYMLDGGWLQDNISLEDKNILKAADYLDLCYKCLDELEMGNTKANHILLNGIIYIGALHLVVRVKEKVDQCLQGIIDDLEKLGPMHDKLVESIIRAVNTSTGTS